MKILVTGSNGFIGHNVCNYLRAKKHKVIGMGRRDKSVVKVENYICCDMSNNRMFDQDIIDILNGTEAIVHLAADMRRDPYTVDVVSTNCGGTERIIQLARKIGIRTIVQLSSLPVIGKPIEHPITEQHPVMPYTTYHVTKVAEELLADFAMREYGIRTSSLRISAPVGEGVNPNTIFPTFVRKALRGEPLTIKGKGLREQTYIHVDDIAQAIEKCILTDAKGVYNLASYNRISNIDLAKKCITLLQSSSSIIHDGESDIYDDYIWDVSIDRLKQDVGYEPRITIEKAILQYANYVREGEQNK